MDGITPVRDRLARALERGNLIKIDGLRHPDHAAVTAAAGADLIGFIFAPARRQVTAETARRCIDAARANAPNGSVVAIGVFVDAPAVEIAEIVRETGIDAVQLHGAEPAGFLQELDVPAIKALRPRPGDASQDVVAAIDVFRAAPVPAAAFLIDGYADGAAGGTGVRADWDLAADISMSRPILLGGGLGPENVGDAIRQVRPVGVDVSSGVETDGEKDPSRIEAFIRAARDAFRG